MRGEAALVDRLIRGPVGQKAWSAEGKRRQMQARGTEDERLRGSDETGSKGDRGPECWRGDYL